MGSAIKFAPPSLGPYASDTDHLSNECYGADEDDIMYDAFERYRVEETQSVPEQESGSSQRPLDLNGLQMLLEDSTLWMTLKLMHTLPLTSITSGENTITTELEKSMSLKVKLS